MWLLGLDRAGEWQVLPLWPATFAAHESAIMVEACVAADFGILPAWKIGLAAVQPWQQALFVKPSLRRATTIVTNPR